MGSSLGPELSLFVAAVLCAGCSVGVGEGYADGFVTDPECGLAEDAYSLGPTFFGGEVLDVGDQFTIQVQRGGNLEVYERRATHPRRGRDGREQRELGFRSTSRRPTRWFA